MSGEGEGAGDQDAAWVRIDTPLAAADLAALIADIERLYRINPMLELDRFDCLGGGRWHMAGRNLANGRPIDVSFAVGPPGTDSPPSCGDGLGVGVCGGNLEIRYDRGLKRRTLVRVERPERGAGSVLLITDDYAGTPADERRARAAEVDTSLTAWGEALHAYLACWHRWRWLPPWRWYMRGIWQPMRPRSRRIAWLIWVVSAFELAAFLAVLAVWRAAS